MKSKGPACIRRKIKARSDLTHPWPTDPETGQVWVTLCEKSSYYSLNKTQTNQRYASTRTFQNPFFQRFCINQIAADYEADSFINHGGFLAGKRTPGGAESDDRREKYPSFPGV